MEQENEFNPEIEQEEQIDTVEEVEVTEDTEDDSTEVELAKAQAEAAKWRRIAQKNNKPENKTPANDSKPQNINNTPVDISEELRLIAKGLSDEEITKLKVIAKGNDSTLSEALKDDMFIAFQSNIKEQERKEKAKLGASKGSGGGETKNGFRPGLTREEHMALWEKGQA